MPDKAENNTREITCQGVVFTVTAPYKEGHVVNAAEAHSLNQTRAENIRNNLAGRVKKAQKELPEGQTELPAETLTELAAIAEAYDSEYEFSMASAGGGARPKDPIEQEAVRLAKAAVAGKLREKGTTVKAYCEQEGGKERYDNAVATTAASDAFRKAAKKAVADRDKLAEAGGDALEL